MRMSTRAATLAAVLIALAVLVVPALASRSHATGTTVKVAASEFRFVISTKSTAHGSVTFVVTNKGKLPHDFKIAGKKTPLLNPGKSAKLTVTLKTGRFPYSCTVAGHASAGMKGSFTAK